MSFRVLEIGNFLRHTGNRNGKFNVIVNLLPDEAPRSGPDTGVTIVNLDNAVLNQDIFNLENG